jgi:hypothetical protein
MPAFAALKFDIIKGCLSERGQTELHLSRDCISDFLTFSKKKKKKNQNIRENKRFNVKFHFFFSSKIKSAIISFKLENNSTSK